MAEKAMRATGAVRASRTASTIVAREGYLNRRVVIVPLWRVQSASASQGRGRRTDAPTDSWPGLAPGAWGRRYSPALGRCGTSSLLVSHRTPTRRGHANPVSG